MGKKRIYEAARKLNMETSELMKILEDRGTPIKSAIASISDEDFESISSSIGAAPPKSVQEVAPPEADKETSSDNEGEAEPAPEPEKVEARKEADVIPISRSRKSDEESREPDSAVEKPAEESQQFSKENAPAEETPQKEPDFKKPELAPTGSDGFTTALSYLAMGLASGALIATFALYENVNNSAARLDRLAVESDIVKADALRANEGVVANKSATEKNLTLVTGVQNQINGVRGDLTGVKGDVEAVSGEVANVQGQVKETQARLASAESQIGEAQGKIANAENQIKNTQGQLTETQSQVSKIEGQVNIARMAELKGDLKARSSSLAELAAVSSGPASVELSDIAQRVGALADSM